MSKNSDLFEKNLRDRILLLNRLLYSDESIFLYGSCDRLRYRRLYMLRFLLGHKLLLLEDLLDEYVSIKRVSL